MEFKEKLKLQIKDTGLDTFTLRQFLKRAEIYTVFEREAVKKAFARLCDEGFMVENFDGSYTLADSGAFTKGVLRGNRRGFAFLAPEDGGEELFIPNRNLKGAQHGDTVLAVRAGGDGSDEGRVVAVLKRGYDKIVGTFVKEPEGYGFVISDDDSYFTDVFIPAHACRNVRSNVKVVAAIDSYGRRKNPEGRIIEVLGREGSVKADMLAIIRSHGFKENFSAEQIAEAAKIAAADVKGEIGKREDFRNLLTVTVDGDDARDFDDAISVEKSESGYRLYVHIADVSHYIKRKSPLDKEAWERATSVYLPVTVLPMLPEAISNGCCSLVEGEDRLTVTAVIDVTDEGKAASSRIVNSVIRSNRRMTYDKVTRILDGDEKLKKEYADVMPLIANAYGLYKILKKVRHARGSIDFVTHESKFEIKDDRVLSVTCYPYTEANGIIEEFMLLANTAVAEFLYYSEYPAVYRVHEPPAPEKVEQFGKFVEGCGYKFAYKNALYSKQFQQLLEKVRGDEAESIISKVMLRSMQKAVYSVTDSGHFGLALEHYCHFTSPIRRYPDLMVHRALKMLLAGRFDEGTTKRFRNECIAAADQSSERERAADMAERDADDYFKAMYMQEHIGESYEGYVSGVTGFGIFVELENTVEGLISVNRLPADRYEFDEKRYTLKGIKHAYTLGNKVKITVTAADVETKRVDFEIYEE